MAKEVEALVGAGAAVREQSLVVVRSLLAKGLVAGDSPYHPGGHVPWSNQDPETILRRIDAEWLELGRNPDIPDIVWFSQPCTATS